MVLKKIEKGKRKINLEIVLYLFIIFILSGLIFKIYYESEDYDCDKCIIIFTHERIDFKGDDIKHKVNSSMNDLYKGFIKNECPVFWDRQNGFMKNE
jgi:hypothetical protein